MAFSLFDQVMQQGVAERGPQNGIAREETSADFGNVSVEDWIDFALV